MANKENGVQDEGVVVVMTDDQGNEYYYEEEMIIPVGEEKYALLVGIHNEEDGHDHCGCGCGCEDDEDVIIAKIVIGEDGEEEYVEPTDEEFEAVQKAYDALVEESEQE
ncbi:MAG: DUF1292 domain-containing protein [Selenomonas sp.]|jgi:hypothetical protein|uniref:DUF1292 domain-containing protein n=1 Tax=Selenomonas sp. AE3005 TaxID=1485543 RepID=UPI000488C8BF|nr:DUF1292 domain-containing protein [Selenomonas sp. AE3005]MBQ1417658.1 DUF1292 domain-containing protein [Selenomonas sp.]MBQ1462322.1 DUF1292 domain-containing protein [Selenomonas sp.]MBQ1613523.1 DUF1292 domain-containing protein [Selenomonas sp.]MBQ1808934.1 DUF1292 domain-containing protein [Selenomonas sp.]MBQ1919585.1 DUF1292 domain-containing protein [Selenomonas sp.]